MPPARPAIRARSAVRHCARNTRSSRAPMRRSPAHARGRYTGARCGCGNRRGTPPGARSSSGIPPRFADAPITWRVNTAPSPLTIRLCCENRLSFRGDVRNDGNEWGRGMKVAVLQFFSWPERRVELATVFARALQRIEIMDRTGFDAVWLAEHHFSSFSVCPSVHMMGVLAAARTTRLRIGTGVSLAPFYHPLRLAEEVALLDVLSGGRVNWGAGRGFARVEFENFGVPPDESTSRFHETVEIVLRAWTEERLSFAGEHYRFKGVEVLPKPMQRPHPPVWMAASSAAAIEWAAGRGF